MATQGTDSSRIVVEFKGKITEVDGVPYVRIPRLTPSHVVIGEPMHVTPTTITARADLLHANDTFRPIDDVPRLTHVSGTFIGTFRIDLGTRAGYLAARQAKEAIVTAWYDTPYEQRPYGLLEMENRAMEAVIKAFAEADA